MSSNSNSSFGWNVIWNNRSHQSMIVDAYGEARIAYMNEGNCDPCWKIGTKSSQDCDVNWFVPGALCGSVSAALVMLAIKFPASAWFCVPLAAFWGSLSMYYLEHIERVTWLQNGQSSVDVFYGSQNAGYPESYHFDLKEKEFWWHGIANSSTKTKHV